MKSDLFGVPKFLNDYPGMSLAPSRTQDLFFKGDLEFQATVAGGVDVLDSYRLKIEIPSTFPRAIPKVWELNGKIPLDGTFHVNPDKTLCLGSPIQVLLKIAESPTIVGFVEACLIPFLYAVSRKKTEGGKFFMGELDHGEAGIIEDYKRIFRLKTRDEVLLTLDLLSLKKRVANKRPCVCGCGKLLGRCQFHYKINSVRRIAPRSWFLKHAKAPGRLAR